MKIDKYSAILGNTVGFHDMSTLTDHRPVASLPFGGKYRLIDFPLSSLANAGVRSIFGIFQQDNISSVFDHIRSGREWGLSTLLSHYYLGIYNTRVESSTVGKEYYQQLLTYLRRSGSNQTVSINCDVLVNIDLKNKEFKSEHKALQLFRMGTCGSVNPDVEVDNMLVTQNVVGLDGLLHFYKDYQFENEFSKNFLAKFPYEKIKPMLYFSEWAESQYEYFKDAKYVGNTATFPGFYAPQGRQLRLRAVDDQFLEVLNDLGVTNFEMETSAIYGMSKLLGHKAITINNVIANRRRGEFAADHHKSEKMMIEWVLERIIK